MMFIVGICTFFFSDDCPQGNYIDMKRNHAMASRPKGDLLRAFIAVAKLPVTWILAFQYACSFGVEIQVHNVLSLYYYDDFKIDGCDPATSTDTDGCRLLTQTKASLISSCFGLMCIFARAMGGYFSDVANRHYDMKGRILVQLALFTGQALFLFIYSQLRSLAWSIPCLVTFGFFAQACTGSSYAIVPYVSPYFTGVTSGIVGAGGNMGGLAWGFLFKAVGSRRQSFEYLSYFVAASAVMTIGIQVEGQRSLFNRNNALHMRGNRYNSGASAGNWL
jgi:NNP family nitrate/nitrite transporter-like MFS transporter